MSNIDYVKLWKFISLNNAVFEVPSHLLCTICQKLISNCRKTPCNCKYCAGCITRYLEKGGVTCCGKSMKCQITVLNLHRDVREDNDINIEICRLNVQCPNAYCTYYSDIWSVCEHNDVCPINGNKRINDKSKQTNMSWGCELAQGFESSYDKLCRENLQEIKLLKEAIYNLRNENKKEIENVLQTNKLQADELKKLSIVTSKMENEITELKASKRQQNVTMDRLNKSNSEFKKSLNKTINEVKDVETKIKAFIESEKIPLNDPLNEKIKALQKEINILNKHYSQIVIDIDRLRDCDKKASLTMGAIVNDIAQLESQAEGICFNMTVLMIKVERLELPTLEVSENDIDHSTCMYTWSVNNFSAYKAEASQKKNRKLTSKDFHASDKSYKIHFDLYPCGYGTGEGEFLSMFAVIKKTDQREWNGALSYDITVSISANGQKHNIVKLGRVEKKSRSDIDHSVGIEKLIEIERIFGEPSLLEDNSLTFEFLVKRK